MRILPVLLALTFAQLAPAQGFFLPTEDFRLREDLALLVDEDVVRMPVNTWPLPAADVREAIARVDPSAIASPALRAALARVSARLPDPERDAEWRLREVRVTAGEPALLRDEATLGRETAELRSIGGATTDRWSLTVAATGVVDPQDEKTLRFDGSELSVRWGNWLFSANQIDRWWGPGHGGGLILSTNARPTPGISLDRMRSTPFDVPVLRWLGPWRFSAFLNVMESQRDDVDQPLFMGMRFSFRPVSILEFGLSRSAQFCGDGRSCDFAAFSRVLIGQDNAGRRGLDDPADEPGNQMAGADMRLVSPFRALPVAIYAEMIGEDNSDTSIPMRYLALFGGEGWWLTDSGSVWRARVEYANTACNWDDGGDFPDCGYKNGIFSAGYRYRGRTIGHTTDSDSETTMFQLTRTDSEGNRWGAQLRTGRLDHQGVADPFNPVSFGPSDYDSLELSWNGPLWGQDLGVQLGYEKQEGPYVDESGVFGFIQWRKPL